LQGLHGAAAVGKNESEKTTVLTLSEWEGSRVGEVLASQKTYLDTSKHLRAENE